MSIFYVFEFLIMSKKTKLKYVTGKLQDVLA
jgi:hypothetical protein